MDEINVIVVKRKDRKNLCLRYTDPITGQNVERSARTANKKEATKRAGEWQAELVAGTATSSRKTKWPAFREAYESHVQATLEDKTLRLVMTTFNVVETRMKPDRANRITTAWVTRFQKALLEDGLSPSTIECYCRHLKAALSWAKEQGMLTTVPKFPRLKKAKSAKAMKGRPVTGEEFDRMLTAAGQMPVAQRDAMRFLLRGLWYSGLRLGEALSLTWDQWADGIRVDTSGEFIVLQIPSDEEKGGRDRTYPITPDFAELLMSVPKTMREGFVFRPILSRGECRRIDTVSKAIVNVGKTAGIKVDEKTKLNRKTKQTEKVVVYASAHDLRRAFGFRWARQVMPMVLKELMRHESVTTTEKFYVGVNAQETARFLSKVTVEVTETKTESQPKAETL